MNVLLVVGNGASPNTADVFIRDRLVGQGHTVTYIDDGTAAPGNLNTAYQLVILARSAAVGQYGTKYDPTTVGVLSMVNKPHTDAAGSGGVTGVQTTEYVLPGSDPIVTGGPNATVTILPSNAAVGANWNDPAGLGAGVVKMTAGSAGTSTTRIVCYRYDVGAAMAVGNAPSRRVKLDLMDITLANATGLAWFDNAVTWASAGNVAPVANAGANQPNVAPGATVTLDSSASTDTSPGTIVSRSWALISGTGGTLSSSTATSPTYTAANDVNGSVDVWRVTVTDDGGLTSTADVTITVAPRAFVKKAVSGSWSRQKLRRDVSGTWV